MILRAQDNRKKDKAYRTSLHRDSSQNLQNRHGEALYRQELLDNVNQNKRALFKNVPHVYNQVAAGRLLPQNSIVLGGTMQENLLEELAKSMSHGRALNQMQQEQDLLTSHFRPFSHD